MSRTKTLPDTGRFGRRLSVWLTGAGVEVLDVVGSRHWRVRLKGPDGREATVTYAHRPRADEQSFEALTKQIVRLLNLPRGP